MSETLTPQERIRKKKEFIFLYDKGNRYRGRYFILVYLANNLNYSRMAVVASKKVGHAVVRNKIKRRFRALFRKCKHLIATSTDLIIIARKNASIASWTELQNDFSMALQALNRNHQHP